MKSPDDNEDEDDAIVIRVTKPDLKDGSNVPLNNEEMPLLDNPNQKSEIKL